MADIQEEPDARKAKRQRVDAVADGTESEQGKMIAAMWMT